MLLPTINTYSWSIMSHTFACILYNTHNYYSRSDRSFISRRSGLGWLVNIMTARPPYLTTYGFPSANIVRKSQIVKSVYYPCNIIEPNCLRHAKFFLKMLSNYSSISLSLAIMDISDYCMIFFLTLLASGHLLLQRISPFLHRSMVAIHVPLTPTVYTFLS